VLAVVALMVGFGVTASAQPVTCNASAGSPPILRAEGYTELAGDILLTCTTGNGQITNGGIVSGTTVPNYTMSVQLFSTTNITSRLLTSATAGVGTSTSTTEALMLVSYAPAGSSVVNDVAPANVCVPGGAACAATNIATTAQAYNGTAIQGPTAFRALRVSDTSVVWQGVPITPPGTNFTIRLTNIRVNATTVPPAGNFPGQVSAFLAISGTSAVTVNNPTQIIGAVQTGLNFAVRNCGDTGGGNPGINQCSGQNSGTSNNILDPTLTGTATGSVRFTEGFAYAFKPGLTAGQDPSSAGTNYNSESGYVNSTALGTETGFASFGFISQTGTAFSQNRMGTRLIAHFSNVPTGVRLFVNTQPCVAVPSTGSAFTTAGVLTAPLGGTAAPLCGSSTIWAQLLQGTDANGFGGSAAVTPTAFVTCGGITNNTNTRLGMTEVTLDPVTGSGVAVWEVQGADPTKVEAIVAQYAIRTSPSLTSNPPRPGTGTASAYGTFGPAYASGSGADKASATLPVPRFIDNPSGKDLFTVNICQTTLLFPFVTTAPGFDTGIALANTSLDPLNRKDDGSFNYKNSNQGACLIYLWQNGTFTGADAKTGFTTPVVPAGSVLTFSLFNGIPLSDGTTKSVTGFNGYMIAQCQFLYAHGFAFISDLGAQKLAQGYLALVMGSASDRSGNPSANETLNN
jgi:hypothetical protein